jgi:predicted PurR-regulated permease PerM
VVGQVADQENGLFLMATSNHKAAEDPNEELGRSLRTIRVTVIGLFLIALVGLVYFARDFLLPVVLAFLFALTLSPIVRFLQKRGIAPIFSAIVLVILMVSVFSAAAFLLSGPVSEWIESAPPPQIMQKVQQKLAAFRTPVDAVVKASEQVETITQGASSPAVQKVVVQQPGILSKAADTLFGGLSMAAVTFVLLLFLLASGTMFYEKMIGILPTFSDKKRALSIAYDVESDVSHYLLTITAINVGLGIFIAVAMAIVGVPNPVLWGVAAALLNFIPYIGAFAGIVMVGLVSLISFDSITYAIIPPVIYTIAAVIEGQFITPILLGRRLELNSVAIFIFVAMWTWLWGIVGAIIAVPPLVSVKVFCDHFEGLASFGEFLSARPKTDEEGTDEKRHVFRDPQS